MGVGNVFKSVCFSVCAWERVTIVPAGGGGGIPAPVGGYPSLACYWIHPSRQDKIRTGYAACRCVFTEDFLQNKIFFSYRNKRNFNNLHWRSIMLRDEKLDRKTRCNKMLIFCVCLIFDIFWFFYDSSFPAVK